MRRQLHSCTASILGGCLAWLDSGAAEDDVLEALVQAFGDLCEHVKKEQADTLWAILTGKVKASACTS